MLRITLKSHSTICIFTRTHKKMWVPYVTGTPKMSQIWSLIYVITQILKLVFLCFRYQVDGFLVENKTVPEVEKMLSSHSESVMLSIVRVTATSMSSSTSPTGESMKSNETSSSRSSLTMNTFPPLVDIPEQKSDRNGNPQQSAKAASSQTDVQKVLREFMDAKQQEGKRRESVHSKQSSHESCSANSGERTPLALSRTNSLREPVHVSSPSIDQRTPVNYENSLKRGDVQHRGSRKSYPAPPYESVDKSKAHAQTTYHQTASSNSIPVSHLASYHSRDSSRDMNGHAFEKPGRNAMSSHGNEFGHMTNAQEVHRKESVHSRENSKDGLTNGEVRPVTEGATENSVTDEICDLSPKQFTRDNPNRKSSHTWGNGRDFNRKRPGPDQWKNERKRSSFRSPPPPSHGKNSLTNWDQCKNVNVHNGSLKAPNQNGNVQQQRPEHSLQTHASSPHVSYGSFNTTAQHQAQNSHMRSRSSSGRYDLEPTGQSQDHSQMLSNDWTSRKEWTDSIPNGFAESKTVPVKSLRQSSQVKDHSTWPKSRGAPECLLPEGRKKPKREREPIPMIYRMNGHSSRDESEQVVKPTPPSRTSSFKASRRHVETNFSDPRRQSSVSVSEAKSQGSLTSPQSPMVTVSPISPQGHFTSNTRPDAREPNGKSLPQEKNGLYSLSQGLPIRREYIPLANAENTAVKTSVFTPVSPPARQQGDSQSECAIVPRVEPSFYVQSSVSITGNKPVETGQVVWAEVVKTDPPFGSGSLASEPSTPSHYMWDADDNPPGPTQAQVIRTHPRIPTYQAHSKQLPSMVNRNRQTTSYYPPTSPDQFLSSRSDDLNFSRSSLPDSANIIRPDSSSGYRSDIPMNSRHPGSGYDFSTGSLPVNRNKTSKIWWPSPAHSSSSDIGNTVK